jgi:hypothetical protein
MQRRLDRIRSTILTKTARSNPALAMTVRQLHTYVGAFIAPSVLFFAFTGSLQLFSLHEAHGTYKPPALIAQLGSVHKDQTLQRSPAPGEAGGDADHDRDHADNHHGGGKAPWNVGALKWFFLAVAICLISSTLAGLWLAFTVNRRKRLVLGLLAAGVILPLLLVLA